MAVGELNLGYSRDCGARHEGATRASCVRVKIHYSRGTEIRNVRQLSVLPTEKLDAMTQEMGPEQLSPSFLGQLLV